jgi:hypothetical protein
VLSPSIFKLGFSFVNELVSTAPRNRSMGTTRRVNATIFRILICSRCALDFDDLNRTQQFEPWPCVIARSRSGEASVNVTQQLSLCGAFAAAAFCSFSICVERHYQRVVLGVGWWGERRR